MRFRLPGKIGVTAATNLLLLAILVGVIFAVQGRSDIESLKLVLGVIDHRERA